MSNLIMVIVNDDREKIDIKTDIKDPVRVADALFSAGLGALERTEAGRTFSSRLLEELLKDYFELNADKQRRIYHADHFFGPNQ